MKKIYFLLFAFALMQTSLHAQSVNTYTFSQSVGTYEPITGGTDIASTTSSVINDNNFSNLPIGFTFNFDGVPFTDFGFNGNGWICLGSSSFSNTTTPLSSGSRNFVIAGMAVDWIARQHCTVNRSSGNPTLSVVAGNPFNLTIGAPMSGSGITTGNTIVSVTSNSITMNANASSSGSNSQARVFDGGVRYQTLGSAPNRKLVVQFYNFSRNESSGTHGDKVSFQIVLHETTDVIDVIYDVVDPTVSGALNTQVGLRGSATSVYNNRTTTGDWSATTAGGANNATAIYDTGSVPVPGLTFTWTPPLLIDMQPTAISGIPSGNCPVSNQPLSVTIKNAGFNPINFATNNAVVDVAISGASTQTFSATVTSGTLASNASQVVLVAPNADFTAAGVHNISATVTVSGDQAPANNSIASNKTIVANIDYYADNDGDGFGNPAVVLAACDGVPAGYVTNNLDCDDTQILYVDADGDGFGSTTAAACGVANNTDCDDNNNAIHQTFAFYVDADGDGFGAGSLVSVCAANAATPPAGYSLNNTDCNDGNASINTVYPFYVDADGDGYGTGSLVSVCAANATTPPAGYSINNTDCNDNIAAINPGHAEVLYNGVDDNCDGQLDEGFQLTTSLLGSSCGTTLASIGSLVGITTVSSAITGYRIKITNGAQVQIIEKTVPHFTFPQFPSYAYATTYSVQIELQRQGVWLGYYGPVCLVSTPAILEEGGATAVSPSQCGITLPKINTLIATTSLQGVTGYRFRITNLTDPLGPNAVQTIDRTQNWFSLPMLTRYNYGTQYRIEIAVKTTGAFGGFGAPCEVSSPPAPSLINCGGTAASGTSTVAATSVQGATQYRFQITRESDLASATIDRNVNYFIFNSIPASAFTPGALYYIRVAVMTAGTWSPFGDACEYTSPGEASKGAPAPTEPAVASQFKATAYPNPFTSEFHLDLVSSGQMANVKVYDMLGRMVDNVSVSAGGSYQLGKAYPSGVYNIVLTQNEMSKTLRVVKR